ncbi:MAG: gamma-glutamyltransferase, partial [Pseudomonadota bacterium]
MSRKAPFAVAAGHRQTAETAAEVLRAGGSAVDAAVAGGLMACVAEPVLASLLGGGFMMVRAPNGETRLLDFFVQTPRAKTREADLDLRAIEADFGEAKQIFHIGAGAIAAPGVAPGLAAAHERLGRMPFAELAAPAAAAARAGVTLTEYQARLARIVAPILGASTASRALHFDGDAPAGVGAAIRNEPLADVLEEFGREGPRFVQEGEVAAALLALDGGHLTRDDLKRYAPRWRDPLFETRATPAGSSTLALNPPPALGGALIAFALRLVGARAGAVDFARALEATARARVETALAEDPAAGAARLLAPDLVERFRRQLAGRPVAARGTTHISVVDGSGMGAALTLSNGAGCGLIAPGTGIMPNNMLGEEDLTGPDLRWPTDVRLSSMMAPTAIERPGGGVVMLGSGGSNRIRTALAQVAARIVDGARLEDAVAA